MVDLRRLHMLRVVHQQGTVTAAAEALHLTPSGVSRHIRELARELKVPLLEPQGRNIRLTPAGYLLIEHADVLLARWEQAQAELESHRAGMSRPLRVAGFTTAVSGLIAPAAGQLRNSHPDFQVHVRECDTMQSMDLLVAGEVDLAVVEPIEGGPPPDDARFEQIPLLEEPFIMLVPAAHPLAQASTVQLADAAAEDWIVAEPGTCDHAQRVRGLCAAAGFSPRIVHSATHWPAVWSLVSNGLGVSLIPQLAEGPAGQAVVRVPVSSENMPMRRILTCVRRGSRRNPLIDLGVQALKDAVHDHQPLDDEPTSSRQLTCSPGATPKSS
ncbi:DNA-binding transcriptional LysR family regulator [Actinopolyspora biskrensis]|uniref:DNA-binding transcriptional LysR family regulator n=1 Tax=Actinopolyspora biskrensis TaxID=1470178 RepID=A0A852Z9L5_9ACTN|nr:LysR family transcriptional regulator [Actinopolyspora biskrensis]NYH80236.1 DNA-binding transcriptional LysR family regulator [Actinopolyspora biskrensis]